MNLELVSEDERRKLYEMIFDKHWKVMKILEVEKDCEIGNHYHKNKDECFIFLSGDAVAVLKTETETYPCSIAEKRVINVPRGFHHTFFCTAGTVIIGLATELHDDSDDYKL